MILGVVAAAAVVVGLVAEGGDHQVSLSWAAYPGADTYRIERADPSDDNTGFQVIASGITATTYVDDEQSFEYSNLAAAYTGGTLILGMLYEYRVIPVDGGVDQTAIGPAAARPDDGYTHPNWTSVNGSTKRDARNCGHWMWDDGNMAVEAGGSLSPGTYEDTIYTGAVFTSAGTYTFNRCWVKQEIIAQGAASVINFNDSTIGPPRGLGASNTDYDINPLIGQATAYTLHFRRSMAFHGGSQFFFPDTIEDSFFVDMTASTGVGDPHMDCIWVDGDGPISIQRNLFEAATRGQSSLIGPGALTSGSVCSDNVFNGLSAHGAMFVGPDATHEDNGFKRYPFGGFNDPEEAANNALNGSGSSVNSFWVDDGSAV